MTIEALNKGIHAFAEKPPGINLEEALEMQKIDREVKDKVLMFGFNHRHHGSVTKMKKIIEDQSLGKILWMRVDMAKKSIKNI